jgi:hypothetical protein
MTDVEWYDLELEMLWSAASGFLGDGDFWELMKLLEQYETKDEKWRLRPTEGN